MLAGPRLSGRSGDPGGQDAELLLVVAAGFAAAGAGLAGFVSEDGLVEPDEAVDESDDDEGRSDDDFVERESLR